MKAIVLHEFGAPGKLKYEDVEDPRPGEGEVLVRLAATSINPVDFKLRSGSMQAYMPLELPTVLGRDLSGVIRELGPGVTSFSVGDRVLALANRTYAELVVVKADQLTLAPDTLDIVEAAALPLVTLTGEQLITRGTKIQQGQTVLITGAVGNVGRAAVHTAKKAGATVIAGVRKQQLDQAKDLHADEILALDDSSAMEKLGYVDAVADSVGGSTAEQLLGKVKPGGVFASVLGPPANARLHPTIHIEPVYAVPDAPTLRVMAEDILARKFRIPIDRMVPLADAADAQAAAEKGGVGKILLLA